MDPFACFCFALIAFYGPHYSCLEFQRTQDMTREEKPYENSNTDAYKQ